MTDKKFDSVEMMRRIRENLSELYTNPDLQKEDLERIWKKYNIRPA